ncbi:MAG: hypothetical protein WCK47_13750 [bacterium]|nr:hypothetical protein [Candidatus Sumerlaeota bacterium]
MELTGTEAPKKGRRRMARLTVACLFAVAGVAACVWSWQYYRRLYARLKPPVPVLDLIPTVPKAHQEGVMRAVMSGASFVLALSPDQRQQVISIWKEPPRTLTELIDKQHVMDKILTPDQLQRLRPVRKMVQDRIVDEMFEAGRDRFSPSDFDKMKGEVKRRTNERMSAK